MTKAALKIKKYKYKVFLTNLKLTVAGFRTAIVEDSKVG